MRISSTSRKTATNSKATIVLATVQYLSPSQVSQLVRGYSVSNSIFITPMGRTTKTLGQHRNLVGATDEWFTPPEIVQACGHFELDPCTSQTRPWDTASRHFTPEDDGLSLPWNADDGRKLRVWMNPPYGTGLATWMKKIALHGNGIALTFARTDTKCFHDWVFPYADSILFLEGRLYFYYIDGRRSRNSSGGPSILIAYGQHNTSALECGLLNHSCLAGHLVRLK